MKMRKGAQGICTAAAQAMVAEAQPLVQTKADLQWTVAREPRIRGRRDMWHTLKSGRPSGVLPGYRGLSLVNGMTRLEVDEVWSIRNTARARAYAGVDQKGGVASAAGMSICELQMLQVRQWLWLPTGVEKDDVKGIANQELPQAN